MTKSLIIGHGGRESALAEAMASDSSVCAVMKHMNPSILESVERTGGEILIGSVVDAKAIADFAEQCRVDIAMVAADSPLEAGVVDALIARGIPTVGPNREGARIEWDKAFSRGLIQEIDPEANPAFFIAKSDAEIDEIFREIGDMEVAVKPKGLTGGKGVKVVGYHLKDNDEARACAKQMLAESQDDEKAVIIEEKIKGVEFTLQVITDGRTAIFPPASYDYPHRFNNDQGPITGSMGDYTMKSANLPFLSEEQYQRCCDISQKVIDHLREKGYHFSGVLNGGFFVTKEGQIKVIEFNSRFGDPECMNIMSLIEQNWIEIMGKIHSGTLSKDDISFKPVATSLNYLVSSEYAIGKGLKQTFSIDRAGIRREGASVHFSSCERVDGDTYATVGNSRVLAILGQADTPMQVREQIMELIRKYVKGPLQYRTDVGSAEDIQRICSLV